MIDKIGNKFLKHKFDFSAMITIFLIAIGIFFRVWQYSINRSLWLDESMLALNIVNRSFLDLFTPLDMNQGAPLFFLLIEKFFETVFGNNEFSLRAFPLFSGIVSLFLVYLIAKEFFSKKIANFTLLLFVFSPNLILYSSELKQYSSDVLGTLLILFLAKKCIDPESKITNFALLASVGSILIFLSHAVLFSVISCCLVLLITFYFSKNKSNKKYALYVIFLWLFLYIIFFIISLNNLANNNSLTNYWQSAFMPLPPWKDLSWFKINFLNNLKEVVGYQFSPKIFAFFFLFGSFSILINKHWKRNLLVLLPIPVCLVFSGFRVYPFSGRMLLFSIPIFYLILVIGINFISDQIYKLHENKTINFLFPLGLIFLLFSNIFSSSISRIENPYLGEHIRPIIHQVITDTDSNNVYIYYSARPAAQYYFEYYNYESSYIFRGSSFRQEPEKYLEELDSLNFKGKTWFIFSHNCTWCQVNEEEFILKYLEKNGNLLQKIEYPGANGYLFLF